MNANRRIIVTVVAIIVFFGTMAYGQDYSRLFAALDKCNAAIQSIKQLYIEERGKTGQLVDLDEMAAEPVTADDRLYTLAVALESVFSEFENTVKETQKVEAARAKNPPEIARGKIDFFGYTHQQFQSEFGDEESSSFVSKRARLGVQGKLNSYARIRIMGEFAGTAQLLDAVFTLSPTSQWSFNCGQYKPPFGTDFLVSASSMVFVNTSLAKGLGTDRDIGFSLNYNQKFAKENSMTVSAGVFNGSGVNKSDVNTSKNLMGRVEFNLAGMFTLAPNFIVGKTNQVDSLKEDLTSLGVSGGWSWKNETILAEYIHTKAGDVNKQGWYIYGAHAINTRAKFLPVIELAARYEQYDANLDADGNRQDRITLGSNLYIDKKYTKIQLNYQINGEETNSVDNNEFLANFQVAF